MVEKFDFLSLCTILRGHSTWKDSFLYCDNPFRSSEKLILDFPLGFFLLWLFVMRHRAKGASQVALVVVNPPVNAVDTRNMDLTPGSGRFPGGGHGSPLQYSCLEKPMDRGAWWATILRVAQSWTQLKLLSRHNIEQWLDLLSCHDYG